MIKIICLILLLTSPLVFANPEDSVAKLFSIFDPIKKKNQKQVFTVDACKIPQKKLMELALLRQPIKASFKFMKDCDVEGEVELHVAKPFPVLLKVRNLDKYTSVRFNSTLSVGTVDEGIGYKVELSGGNLSSSKSNVQFSGFYNYIVSLGETKGTSTSEGGELIIDSIDGKKVGFRKLLGKGKSD